MVRLQSHASVPLYLRCFHWIELSALSIWMRESPSALAFPNILFLHTLAMGWVAGVNAAIDLRILGFASSMRLAPMEKFLPLAWSAFLVSVVTGILLLVAYPTKAFTNPVWYIKFAFIGLAIVNTRLIRDRVLRHPSVDALPCPAAWKVLAVSSLLFWAGAIVSGKLLAHTYTRLFSY